MLSLHLSTQLTLSLAPGLLEQRSPTFPTSWLATAVLKDSQRQGGHCPSFLSTLGPGHRTLGSGTGRLVRPVWPQHLHLTSSTSLEELVYLCKEKTQHNAFTSVKQNLNAKAHQWQQARLVQVLVLLSHNQLRWMHQIIRPVKKTGSIIK